MLCHMSSYTTSSNTGSALILLRNISSNTIAVAVTLVVFLYFQMILETCMIDQHLNFINLKIEIISISIQTRISLVKTLIESMIFFLDFVLIYGKRQLIGCQHLW